MTRKLKTVFCLTLATLAACKLGDQSETAGKEGACYQPDLTRCMEASGPNDAYAAGQCQGEVYDSCPTKDEVGICVTSEGKSNETTIHYYDGMAADGKTDCEGPQSVYGGKYYPGE